jgi:hypothetical protein
MIASSWDTFGATWHPDIASSALMVIVSVGLRTPTCSVLISVWIGKMSSDSVTSAGTSISMRSTKSG